MAGERNRDRDLLRDDADVGDLALQQARLSANPEVMTAHKRQGTTTSKRKTHVAWSETFALTASGAPRTRNGLKPSHVRNAATSPFCARASDLRKKTRGCGTYALRTVLVLVLDELRERGGLAVEGVADLEDELAQLLARLRLAVDRRLDTGRERVIERLIEGVLLLRDGDCVGRDERLDGVADYGGERNDDRAVAAAGRTAEGWVGVLGHRECLVGVDVVCGKWWVTW